MPIVKLYGSLRRHAGQNELSLSGETIKDVLEALCRENPSLYSQIFEGEELRSHVRVMITGHDIELDEGLETEVKPEDVVAIFPAIAGGSLENRVLKQSQLMVLLPRKNRG